MRINILAKSILFIGITMAFFSCGKEEGIGGRSAITGKLIKINFSNDDLNRIDTSNAAGEDVYIIYGNNDFYNDDIETHFDGTFQFNYLNKGKYTIFAYSKDTLGSDSDIPIFKEVEIGSNNETVDIGQVFIYDGLVGKSINGKVYKIEYLTDYTRVLDTAFAMGEDVYIAAKGEGYFITDVETNKNGSFRFNGLPPGDYEVFVYSDDPLTGDEKSVIKEISLGTAGWTFDIGTVYIYKGLEGTSSISGRVWVKDKYNANDEIKCECDTCDDDECDIYFAEDEEVFIIYEDNITYFERVRTNHDGAYEFTGLIPGIYKIYAYRKDPDTESGINIVYRADTIKSANQSLTGRDLTIYK